MGSAGYHKALATNRMLRENGTWRTWTTGLTKGTDERIAAIVRKNTGRKRSPEARARMRASRIAYMKRASALGSFGHTHAVQLNGRIVVLKSSYELNALHMLQRDPTVVSIEYEPFALPCPSGIAYVPDFLITRVDGSRSLIEVKSVWYVGDSRFPEKAAAGIAHAEACGMTYEVWTERTHPGLAERQRRR